MVASQSIGFDSSPCPRAGVMPERRKYGNGGVRALPSVRQRTRALTDCPALQQAETLGSRPGREVALGGLRSGRTEIRPIKTRRGAVRKPERAFAAHYLAAAVDQKTDL